MIKPKILDKNQLIMRELIGTATNEENGEEIEFSRSINGMSIIVRYKGETLIWSVKDMIEKSIELIDDEDLEEDTKWLQFILNQIASSAKGQRCG